jgi:hypothetical protein
MLFLPIVIGQCITVRQRRRQSPDALAAAGRAGRQAGQAGQIALDVDLSSAACDDDCAPLLRSAQYFPDHRDAYTFMYYVGGTISAGAFAIFAFLGRLHRLGTGLDSHSLYCTSLLTAAAAHRQRFLVFSVLFLLCGRLF